MQIHLSKDEKTRLSSLLDGKSLLITGGTGSYGQKCVRILLDTFALRRVIVFSRGELKQFELRQSLTSHPHFDKLRFFIGDIRDRTRLMSALRDVDYVIHAAALKQVDTAEYNPGEAIQSNINGTQNVLEVSIERGVKRVIVLSTDKAVSPSNLYGATKMVAERLTIAANNIVGKNQSLFSIVRYGNVIGSNGSVVRTFLTLGADAKQFPITDERMTRFLIGIRSGVVFSLRALLLAQGGEIFIPRIPSVKIVDLAACLLPHAAKKLIGVRPGEKIHEKLIDKNEQGKILAWPDRYVIYPLILQNALTKGDENNSVEPGFTKLGSLTYSSEHTDESLTGPALKRFVSEGMEDMNYGTLSS